MKLFLESFEISETLQIAITQVALTYKDHRSKIIFTRVKQIRDTIRSTSII
ncbi:12802_t:CDS:2 [Racocetra persica]|uniref:12802_t:CDS:1 n=1 Tax=Racocetra persica TaxID=160502 RepID=A0ACA9KFZ9_9GLOM|nr:12802_t:CDS:2 [Racocetra persica]